MIVFTAMGVLWFWMICFEIGYGLGWLADQGSKVLIALADVLVGTRQAEMTALAVMAHLNVEGGERG